MNFATSVFGSFKLLIKNLVLLIFFVFSPNSYALERFELWEKLYNSTVRINVWNNHDTENAEHAWGGSGIVFNKYKDTYFILTNAHVVLDSYCLLDESYNPYCKDKFYPDSATIVVDTPFSTYEYPVSNEDFIFWKELDIAILALDFDFEESFQIMEIGEGLVHPLQQVYSAGFPIVLGNDQPYRELYADACVINSIHREEGMEQLSNYSISHGCSISGGMSGGPLVTEDGKLVGVNGLRGLPDLEQSDYDQLNYAYAIHIYNLYEKVLITDSGNFNPRSKFYNFLPRLSQREHQALYDYFLNDLDAEKKRLYRMFK